MRIIIKFIKSRIYKQNYMIALPAAAAITVETAKWIVGILGALGIIKTVADVMAAKESKKDEKLEVHRPWIQLEEYQKKVRRGYSKQIGVPSGYVYKEFYKEYLYEVDKLHDSEMEVYTLKGSTGIHCGACPTGGGTIYKAAKPGRTIKL